ncbi:MAG: hypothetical protein AB8G99_00250 [Planctomycetaceae bacterium]
MSHPALDRSEYIEQAYFFRVYRERLDAQIPSQEILQTIHEEILATTRLPMAIDFLRGEIMLSGRISDAMGKLGHYFTKFQAFVMSRAEEDRSKFDQRIALQVLEREAEYRSGEATMAGLFVYQFESIARNRLGYKDGMVAMACDPFYDEHWQRWIIRLEKQLGTRDLAGFIYGASEQYRIDQNLTDREDPALFGAQEGRIAKANIGRELLYMFAALQRQLDYPTVPEPERNHGEEVFHPMLEQRLHEIEKRLQLIEADQKGGIDLTEFINKPQDFTNRDGSQN